MNRIPSFGLTILIALFIVGCDVTDAGTESDVQTQTELLPLAVGNAWVMNSTLERESGNFTSVRLDTIRVTADTTIQDEVWYRVVDSGGRETFYATNDQEGLWKWSDPQDPNSSPYLALRHPATPGDVYSPRESESIQIVSVDTTMSVEAGDFISTFYESLTERVEIGGTSYENTHACDFYFAPGTGYIKQVIPYASPKDEGLDVVAVLERSLVNATLE